MGILTGTHGKEVMDMVLGCVVRRSLRPNRIFMYSGHFYIAPLQVHYCLEALPTTARILYRSFTPKRTGNCRYRTCQRSLCGG